MKLISKMFFVTAALCFCMSAVHAEAPQDAQQKLKIAVVNFKSCVENSKLGKQEQSNFEGLKKKMESTLEEREKVMNEMANKLNDNDYLDSLTAEAETELKRNFRQMSQEMSAQQNQFYQTLSQTNVKVIQKMTDMVTKAANQVAKQEGFDIILTEEAVFFAVPALDISPKIIAILDNDFEKEDKDSGSLIPSKF